MARPREFSEEDVLERAMHVFWSKGYAATSLQDLVAAMGISKSSFYDTFHGKRELFLITLGLYGERLVRATATALEAKVSPRQAIEDIFGDAIDGLFTQGGRFGCLAVNTAAELAANDLEIAARVQAIFVRLEDTIQQGVARGQSAGDIRADRSARVLARYLVGILTGLRVMGKANPDRGVLNDFVRVALTALDGG
ncbi:MAG: TetR/AcrR family transcriptional regulator [Pseudomonadota bacterium]